MTLPIMGATQSIDAPQTANEKLAQRRKASQAQGPNTHQKRNYANQRTYIDGKIEHSNEGGTLRNKDISEHTQNYITYKDYKQYQYTKPKTIENYRVKKH